MKIKNFLENLSSSSINAVEKGKQKEKPKTPENPEIGRLEIPTTIILEKILGNIEKGEYNLIIGADASGRIPTLVFKKFIDYVYQKLGYPLAKTIFLAGAGMGLRNEDYAKEAEKIFLKSKRGGGGERVYRKMGSKKSFNCGGHYCSGFFNSFYV